MDNAARIVNRIRIVSVLLHDVVCAIKDEGYDQRREMIHRVAEATAQLHDILDTVFQTRPELNYFHAVSPAGIPSNDVAAHARVASTLARAYLLVVSGSIDEGRAVLAEHLESESSEFHKGWLAHEIQTLVKLCDS